MNILVTGTGGQLGNELRRACEGSGNRFLFTDVKDDASGLETLPLDITNRDAVEMICESEGINVIVNCAAYTNVDAAEDDIAFAQLLNCTGPENLAYVARKRGATLIHISTDYIFGGEGCTPVREDCEPDPHSVYGSTKLAGEKAVKDSGCNYIILRTAWLYSPFGRNFVKTILKLASQNKSLKVVYDQVGSPTAAADLAAAILHIIESGQLAKTGIYNYTDEGAVSWYDFACEICSAAGSSCRVTPCLSGEFPTKAARPHYSVLDKALVKETFGVSIPHWKESLHECLKALGY
ncbi:MAG: dTDP-4-dehydrorhamnose reductase [Bacteroidales bacterium]|nr:dTDP-4-dehydrorhamnose reductase [Bacteroidales bacterium]